MRKIQSKLIFLMILLLPYMVRSQLNIYLFPGQGSDQRIFSELKFDTLLYKINYIKYPVPAYNNNMQEYARSLISQIDTNKEYIFIGVSIGGMICTELTDILNPKQVVIISSAKTRDELPVTYRWAGRFSIGRFIPPWAYKVAAQILQPIVEPDRKVKKRIFKSMLHDKNAMFLKRTAVMIAKWDRKSFNPHIVHIHGDKDHTLPVNNVKCDYKISGGSHMMTLTKAESVNEILIKILK